MNLIEHLNKIKHRGNGSVDRAELAYVMQKINPEQLLSSLGVRFLNRRYKNHIIGWCPDHYHYTRRIPSHPKWYLNILTGTTICYTEGRISNILEVIKNIAKIESSREALEYLIGNRDIKIPCAIELNEIYQKEGRKQDEERRMNLKKTLDSLKGILEEGSISEEGKRFFEKNGITSETIRKFGVVEVDMSNYRDRVIIPFRNIGNELIGYGAVSILNRRQWVRKRISRFKFKSYADMIKKYRDMYDNYKKVVFCPNSDLVGDLFGLNHIDIKNTKEVVLVEGERDVMKLQQEGISAVGTHGCHLTFEQVELLKKCGIQDIVLAYDSDVAGRKCSEKIMREYSKSFNTILELRLEDGKDPKDYDRDSFLSLVENTKQKNQNKCYWRFKINGNAISKFGQTNGKNDKIQV